MWKQFVRLYDWACRADFARNVVQWIFGETVWAKIGVGLVAGAAAVIGWSKSLGLSPWQRAGIVLLFAIGGLLAAHLAITLWEKIRARAKPAGNVGDAPQFITLQELFVHIHPTPLGDRAERDAIGRAIIDQILSGQLASYGRRIDGSRRLALEPIPHNVWARAKFTYWFLDSRYDKDSLHVECPRGEPGMAPLHYADVRVIREQALRIWEYIPMRDAARIAYENTRESLYATAAERFGREFGTGPEGTLHFYANAMFLYRPIYGEKPPSSLRELIPLDLRPSTTLTKDCAGLRFHTSKQPCYVNLTISRGDLDEFIAWASTTRLEVEPG